MVFLVEINIQLAVDNALSGYDRLSLVDRVVNQMRHFLEKDALSNRKSKLVSVKAEILRDGHKNNPGQ